MTDSDTPRILLIDDEPSIREPLSEYLESQGFAVSDAASAAEARSVLRAKSIDLVVSDIMMPGEDGLSLTRHLRETSNVPVILLTAWAEDTERIRSEEHTSELQSLMRISYAVFCLKKNTSTQI